MTLAFISEDFVSRDSQDGLVSQNCFLTHGPGGKTQKDYIDPEVVPLFGNNFIYLLSQVLNFIQ